MDYKKRYEEIIVMAKELKEANPSDESINGWIDETFPELAESEDEKIRKALIDFHRSTIDINGINGERIVAWLERQGERKIVTHKFRKGDVITSTKNLALKYKIKEVGLLNELGEYDYIVENVADNPDYKGRIHKMTISKVDTWGVLVDE